MDKDALVEQVHRINNSVNTDNINSDYYKGYDAAIRTIIRLIEWMPTYDDWFYSQYTSEKEPVRCRDCAVPHNVHTGCPRVCGRIVDDNWFCADGERKEGE